MQNYDVLNSLCDFSREFTRNYINPKLNSMVVNAIVVDFLNYYSYMHYCIILDMHTKDLQSCIVLSSPNVNLDKPSIHKSLSFHKNNYASIDIFKSINKNMKTNECKGKASGDKNQALNVVETFINMYVASI